MNMDTKSNVLLANEARKKLMVGVDTVADAVKLTLGAAGGNAVLEASVEPFHMVTNDGVSIARHIVLADPIENIGANIIKEIASRSDKESGDGTTTSTVLAQAILHAGEEADASPMDVKRSLDECLPIILKAIDDQKRDITPDEVGQVATISGESEELGAIFQDIYKQIGKDGIVELDTSNLQETFYEVTDGVRLRGAGYFGQYSLTEPGKAVYKNPSILITSEKISTLEDLAPIVKKLTESGKSELVIFCDDIDMSVAEKLAYTHLQGGLKTLLIKAPTLWKDWITEDFAVITQATVVSKKEGLPFKDVQLAHLGTCEKLITTKDETRVIGIGDISGYVQKLKDDETEESKLRAAWLQTKVAVLKLGASTETELSYKRLKAEDARNASYLALQEGIVPGGGVALWNASINLPDTVGGTILRKALVAPINQIAENAGAIVAFVEPNGDANGFNAKTGELVNMWEAGIVDPAKVVKNAIKNAISVAGTVLTTNIVAYLPPQPPAPTQPAYPTGR